MAQFEVRLRKHNIGKDELLNDLKRVASQLGNASVTKEQYRMHGSFAPVTVVKALGSWNGALAAAALEVAHRKGIPDEEFHSNIAAVWTTLGRQPVSKDMSDRATGSAFPIGTYKRRFGTWNTALIAFAEFLNRVDSLNNPSVAITQRSAAHGLRMRRTPRDINWRLRAKILIRDACVCQMCGDSPAKSSECVLHVDHIIAWSNGGETVEENLQTLCEPCNIGKSNMDICELQNS